MKIKNDLLPAWMPEGAIVRLQVEEAKPLCMVVAERATDAVLVPIRPYQVGVIPDRDLRYCDSMSQRGIDLITRYQAMSVAKGVRDISMRLLKLPTQAGNYGDF